MSSSEAATTDPAHRLFLECAWECLEGAGIVPGRGAPCTGVFGGCEGNYRDQVLATIEDLRTTRHSTCRCASATRSTS